MLPQVDSGRPGRTSKGLILRARLRVDMCPHNPECLKISKPPPRRYESSSSCRQACCDAATRKKEKNAKADKEANNRAKAAEERRRGKVPAPEPVRDEDDVRALTVTQRGGSLAASCKEGRTSCLRPW